MAQKSFATPRNYEVIGSLPFIACHLACFGVIWTGVTWQALVLCAGFYFVGMFAVTGGYHRYFSHRTYKTSRAFQFILAWLAQSTAQKGTLWWAAHHRNHHKLSDELGDIHSTKRDGLFYAHVGWFFNRNGGTDLSRVKDLAKYPELRFLNTWYLLPAVVSGILSYLFLGGPGLVVGFFWSLTLLWHGTFLINSLAHVIGKRRFDTTDDSKNSLVLALITLGEGWHNNHHHYMGSTRQGFYWWEVDITYYVLRGLQALGIVWGIKEPPAHVLAEGRASDGFACTS